MHEDPAVTMTSYPGTVRQLVVTGLGREQPTVIITNDNDLTTRTIITRYAPRMTIEQRLAEIIRALCADALSSTVNLNVDLDVVLAVLAQALTAALRTRLPGYATVTPDTIQRRFLETPGRSSPTAKRGHRPPRTPRLLTRPAVSRPAPRHPRPLVGTTGPSATSSPEGCPEPPVRNRSTLERAAVLRRRRRPRRPRSRHQP